MDVIPPFQTRRLLLRPVTLADVPSYQRHFVDYEVIQHLSAAVPWPYPEDGVRDYLETTLLPQQGRGRWSWGICELDRPDEVIGVVELWRPGTPENRGFWLGRRFWGRGYMTEAVAPVTDYAFTELGFDVLIFANAVGNVRSRRVKEKAGARLTDVRPAAFVNPAYTEHELWELTKAEWEKRRADEDEPARHQ